MRPKSYREERKPCVSCKHSVLIHEYDDPNKYFCTKNAPPRPLCGSVAMEESYWTLDDREQARKHDREWEEWSEGRQVNQLGTCDEHEE